MTQKLGSGALALWVSLGFWSCAKKPNNPVFPTDDQFPPQPRDLVIAYTDMRDFYQVGAVNTKGFETTVQWVLSFGDGTQGDQKAGDSVYEVNYHIPQEVQVIQAKIQGNFTDCVGNLSEPVMAATQITIQKPPEGGFPVSADTGRRSAECAAPDVDGTTR